MYPRYTPSSTTLKGESIGDTSPLFEGSITIADAITKNIDRYIHSKVLLAWGVKAAVTVTTRANTIVYPGAFSQRETSDPPIPPIQIAKDNYAALNKGFIVTVDVGIARDQFLSYAILAAYIFLSILFFSFYYRRGSSRAALEGTHIQSEIDRLLQMEQTHQHRLETLNEKRKLLSAASAQPLRSFLPRTMKRFVRRHGPRINTTSRP